MPSESRPQSIGANVTGCAPQCAFDESSGGGVDAALWFDGASKGNPGSSAVGVVGKIHGVSVKISQRVDDGTCNQAEYAAVIAALELALDHEAQVVRISGDSQLVVRQLEGAWKVKDLKLQPLYAKATQLMKRFRSVSISWVPRDENSAADSAANQAFRSR